MGVELGIQYQSRNVETLTESCGAGPKSSHDVELKPAVLVSIEWGRIMERNPDELVEHAMIAATARVYHLIVATRKEHDFKRLEVRILNPFKAH